jgi:hypothetical protein
VCEKGWPAGVEPVTTAVTARRSACLSYGQREDCLTGAAGLEPAKPLGRLFEGQAALSICIRPLACVGCARRDSNSQPAGFKPAASAVWATRARVFEFGTGGEIRTHKSRLLRTVCLPFAPLPHAMLEGGVEPPKGLAAHGDLSAVRLPVTPPQPKFPSPEANSGGRTRTPTACSKDRRPAFRRPRNEKRTRHDSNVRPQASQTCALIHLSYGFEGRMKDKEEAVSRSFILQKAEAVRVERTGARTPGGLAHRCTTFCATPPNDLAEGAGVEPAGALQGSDSFRDCLACPCPTFPVWQGRPDSNREERVWSPPVYPLAYAPSRCIRRDSNPHALCPSHSFTGCCRAVSASDARL